MDKKIQITFKNGKEKHLITNLAIKAVSEQTGESVSSIKSILSNNKDSNYEDFNGWVNEEILSILENREIELENEKNEKELTALKNGETFDSSRFKDEIHELATISSATKNVSEKIGETVIQFKKVLKNKMDESNSKYNRLLDSEIERILQEENDKDLDKELEKELNDDKVELSKQEMIAYVKECRADFKKNAGRINAYESICINRDTGDLGVLTLLKTEDKATLNSATVANMEGKNFAFAKKDKFALAVFLRNKYKKMSQTQAVNFLSNVPVVSLKFNPAAEPEYHDEEMDTTFINLFERTHGEYYRVKGENGENNEVNWDKIPATKMLLENVFRTGNLHEGKTYVANILAHQLRFPWINIPVVVTSIGNTGSGKGLTVDYIIAKVLGERHVNKSVTVPELLDRLLFVENKMAVILNEVEVTAKEATAVERNLKLVSTENTATIRRFGQASETVPVYCSIWAFSNKTKALPISANDRRNVVFESSVKITNYIRNNDDFKLNGKEELEDEVLMDHFIAMLEKEYKTFVNELINLKVDMGKIRRLVQTNAKTKLMNSMRTPLDHLKTIFETKDIISLDTVIQDELDLKESNRNKNYVKESRRLLYKNLEKGYITASDRRFLFDIFLLDESDKYNKIDDVGAKHIKTVFTGELLPADESIEKKIGGKNIITVSSEWKQNIADSYVEFDLVNVELNNINKNEIIDIDKDFDVIADHILPAISEIRKNGLKPSIKSLRLDSQDRPSPMDGFSLLGDDKVYKDFDQKFTIEQIKMILGECAAEYKGRA